MTTWQYDRWCFSPSRGASTGIPPAWTTQRPWFGTNGTRSLHDRPLVDQLNELGREGWELVGVTYLRRTEVEYLFKRPVTDKA